MSISIRSFIDDVILHFTRLYRLYFTSIPVVPVPVLMYFWNFVKRACTRFGSSFNHFDCFYTYFVWRFEFLNWEDCGSNVSYIWSELKAMKKYSGSYRNSGAYTSPGTPEYGGTNIGEIPKGWCSERVPLPTSSISRRHISAAALIPFNSGRVLPSKWDDAERWITSPVSGYSPFKMPNSQPQRQPKSKSGPQGSPELIYLPNYSPTMENGSVKSFMRNSPLTTGVLVPSGLSIHYDGRITAKYNSLYCENDISRSTSLPGLSDLLSEPSVHSSQDDRLDDTKEEDPVSLVVLHRDMATQMSPEGSTHSSSKGRLSFSILPSSSLSQHMGHEVKEEIRDVEVDKGTSTGCQSKEQALGKMKELGNFEDLPLPWSAAEATKNIKLQRKEGKISAWENLQKAKSEAAIQKLEMKLEKRRSASMNKILKKLETAQVKAQAMRNSLLDNDAPQTSAASRLGDSCSIFAKIRPLSRCFPSHWNQFSA